MEFSDTDQPHPPHKQQLSNSNQSIAVKQNHSLPSTTDQSSSPCCHLSTCDSTAVDMGEPCPSVTTIHTRYYKLVQEYLANKNGGHCVSHDAWTNACEYFDNVQPHPLTVDWSEFIFITKAIK